MTSLIVLRKLQTIPSSIPYTRPTSLLQLRLKKTLSPSAPSFFVYTPSSTPYFPSTSGSMSPLFSTRPRPPLPAAFAAPPIPHLHGKTRFGDNLEDEWFIVFLLFEISRAFPSLSIRVWDSDGEFLLIEAAFSLPRWLDPESSPNRVFIRDGDLHIVPKHLFPSTPSLSAALEAVKNPERDTRASDSIQSVIKKKIGDYPDKVRTNMHRVVVRVPLPVAQVLKHEPCLISLAVEGFYNRDLDSMKHASRMDKFLRLNGTGGALEIVRISVQMTRIMYAQLVQQRFQAPRCYPMPGREEGSVVYKEAELGMKIACGFEMMYQERKTAGNEGKGSTWDAFRESLDRSGCFDGLIPGSKEYHRIMDGALEYYRSTSLFSRTRDIMVAPVKRIDEILASEYSINDFNGKHLSPSDDDYWLYDGQDELNSALLERQKEMEAYESKCKKGDVPLKQSADSGPNDFNVKDVADSMQAFVKKMSSFEGAEVPHEWSKEVELNAELFGKEMETVLGPLQRENSMSDTDLGDHNSSSDMDFEDSEEEREIGEDAGTCGSAATFMQCYSDALNEELGSTSLKESFIRAPKKSIHEDEGTSKLAEDVDGELTPLDLDINLVQSFLDSFTSQQGLPGPASNLLELMGIKLPADRKDA
ncbi:hypothetical protein HPP92_014869 [Vanilla planifolia]|uniref:Protein ecdysoneless homolog n=1 Tax=Vanilla planifolia TaxID=51239 RepID=A0A835QP45_VANPL|nr:hypothetical protein HPP92_014869 [Vanilla planifolia]